MVVLAVLPLLAYASPPDPTWIEGMYDDDDGDDAILAITSADTAFDEPEYDLVAVTNLEIEVPAVRSVLRVMWRSTIHGRAPPWGVSGKVCLAPSDHPRYIAPGLALPRLLLRTCGGTSASTTS